MMNRKKAQIILIVEDESMLREALWNHFKTHFEVITAATGEAAIEKVTSEVTIDLLITDFDLRGKLDGLDVARAVRAKYPKVPILLLTGSDPELPRVKELLSLSKTVLFGKPFQKALLDQAVASFLAVGNSSPTINSDELL